MERQQNHYLFDIDGTLTEPRCKMDNEGAMSFLSWMTGKSVFLVAGSDMTKVSEQVPNSIIRRCSGIFSSMANEFFHNDQWVYRNEWKPPIELISELCKLQMSSPYPIKRNNYLEERSGMLNFSVAGRESSIEERKKYSEWDKVNKERVKIVEKISKDFPGLDLRIGGQISIDISPKGNNKSLASRWIRKNLGGKIYFFGDSCFEGGNDYDICVDVDENKDGQVFSVKSNKETFEILRKL